MTRFKAFAAVEDQQPYLLSRLAAKITAIESLQNFCTDAAAYSGCKPDAATKLAELRAALETAQAKLIEVVAAQAADE